MISRHSRRHPRATFSISIGVCVALLFGLLWLFRPAPTLSAQSQPDALGAISGVVRNEQGEPLPNIAVTLYPNYSALILRTATTDAQGVYTLLSIPPGAYRVRFQDNGKQYASLFYGNGSTLDDAAEVNVSGNNVSGIDMQLALGGTISVTIEPALSITNSSVVLTLFAKTTTGHWRSFDSLNWPVANPELTFYGVPSGSYRLCAQPTYYRAECFDNVIYDTPELPDEATEIVINGSEHKTVTIRFGDLTQLQGSVRSPDGNPLPTIDILLQSTPNNDGGGAIYTTQTDTHGHFQFEQLPDFEYMLYAVDPTLAYLPSYYKNSSNLGQFTPIKIDRSSHLSITLTLSRAGSITGKLRLQGGGLPSSAQISIYKVPLLTQICTGVECTSIYNPATGVYTITGLTTGIYRVGASVSEYPGVIPTGFYGGQDVQSAANIAVTTGKMISSIDITIGEGFFDSSIQGTATANGAPVAGIEVGLFPYEYGTVPFIESLLVSTQTDNQGNYRFEGLPNGDYAVAFYDPKSVYAMTFYDGNAILPNPIFIDQTTAISDINVALTPGATIRGKVKRVPGKNLSGIFVRAILLPDYTLPYLIAETDIHGNYEIKSVPPGTYLIALDPPSDAPRGGIIYYPATFDQNMAQPLVVATGDLLTGIDISIELPPSAYLPTVKGNQPTPVR